VLSLSTPKHILAVDDEANVRRLVQMILQRAGYRVSTAADGIEALATVEKDRPDVVLADITMPRLDGIELLRRLKADEATAGIPVIILSAKSQDQDFFEAERSGAVTYLPKPFSPLQLMSVVSGVLDPPTD
jgi:CheY-like chemotaxis protein